MEGNYRKFEIVGNIGYNKNKISQIWGRRRMTNLWDITDKTSTKTKLALIEGIFDIWLTIWNGPKQRWVHNKEWYVIDLFAGKGYYIDNGRKVDGSFIIFLRKILYYLEKLRKNGVKIKIFGVEKNKNNFRSLENEVNNFFKENPVLKGVVESEILNGDCNNKIDSIISQIVPTKANPLFVLVDPTGLQVKRSTMEKIVRLINPKDILFNYILEGVRRTSGVASKLARQEAVSLREIKTVSTLMEFLGDDIDIIKRERPGDIQLLKEYIRAVFSDKDLKVVGYDVKYPNRNDYLYYLLFASRKITITDIVKNIYARQKSRVEGPSLFGPQSYEESILEE